MNAPQVNLEVLQAKRPRVSQGVLAISLTLFAPGLGHLVAGQPKLGVIWFAFYLVAQILGLLFLCFPNTVWVALLFIPLPLLVIIAACWSAYRSAMRSSRGRTSPLIQIAAAGLLLLALPFVSLSSLLARLGANFARSNFIEAFVVAGRSMNPALLHGDHVLFHGNQGLSRWDIVVFEDPEGEPGIIVSRIVGLPTEHIRIINGVLEVNGQLIQLPVGVGPYTCPNYFGLENRALARKPGAGCESNPVQLGPNDYFVLGDNSEKSKDSRLWEIPVEGHPLGALPGEFIRGRGTAIYWPPERWRLLD